MRDLEADLGIARGMKPLNTSEYYEGISLETAQQYMMAAEGWPHAIERALELEEELTRCGNTLVELTIALKDDRKRADKAEALNRELVEAMNDLLYEYEDLILRLPCSTPVRGQPIHYNSQAAKQAENLLTKFKEVLGE